MQPEISVVIPAYLAERYIAGTLASVRQSIPEGLAVEILVVDAGGSDLTMQIVEELASRDGRIIVIRPGERLTAPGARNAGLAVARAPILALLDADDQMMSQRLAEHRRALVDDPELLAVGGGLIRIDGAGIVTSQRSDVTETGEAPLPLAGSPGVVRFLLPRGAPTLSSALTFRTAALREVGGFVEEAPYSDDYHLVVRLCRLGPVRMLPEPAAWYRWHGDQTSQRSRAPQELEVLLLRRRILAEVMGREPPFSSVVALATPTAELSATDRERAVEDLDEYARCFLALVDPGDEERRSIVEIHARWRRQVVAGRADGF